MVVGRSHILYRTSTGRQCLVKKLQKQDNACFVYNLRVIKFKSTNINVIFKPLK